MARNSEASDVPKGLGSVDSKRSEITVSVIVEPSDDYINGMRKPKRKRSKKPDTIQERVVEPQTVECTLEQDPASLRSRTGDTGEDLFQGICILTRFLAMQGASCGELGTCSLLGTPHSLNRTLQ